MQTRRKIAVAGATGSVGRHVVDLLEADGHEVVPMSRSSGVDVVTGDGLAEALQGVSTIIDAATQGTPDAEAATAFFTAATRNLQEVGARTGVGLIMVVSHRHRPLHRRLLGCEACAGAGDAVGS